MPSIQLYAELLFNIRTVTLFASLQTEHTKETKAELSADGETLTLTHEGESASIRLPTQISGGGSAALTLPASPAKELTFRLQLQEKSPGLLKFRDDSDNPVPWPATSLESASRIRCRDCGHELVKTGSISTWKDLPSESWAEMMDFWHCHKPDEHHHHGNEAGKNKGYAASNRLRAVSGTGFVDLSYLLLAEQDCCGVNLKRDAEEGDQLQYLPCSSCGAIVGMVDNRADGWRLYKWSLSISSSNSPIMTHKAQEWVSAQLLALIETQGIRKFVTKTGAMGTDADSLLLWVFTPDLSFSSSVQRELRNDPTRAMKVLWQPIQNAQEVLQKQNMSIEELRFPDNVTQVLFETLKSSASLLPTSARKFQEWNVGLLERFTDTDLS